jgi:hypothetical protein
MVMARPRPSSDRRNPEEVAHARARVLAIAGAHGVEAVTIPEGEALRLRLAALAGEPAAACAACVGVAGGRG